MDDRRKCKQTATSNLFAMISFNIVLQIFIQVFGPLNDGVLVQQTLNMARRLLSPESVTLNCLAR
jgi:hypothetical protein